MLFNWQPTLGRGCSHEIEENKELDISSSPFHLNLMGRADATRFLAFAALKETYVDDKDLLPAALELVASDLQDALLNGIKVRSGYVVRLALIACKGDWPWLIEAGGLLRNFRHAPNLVMSEFIRLWSNPCLKCGFLGRL